MSHRPFKQRLYAQFARVGNALASDKRLELIDLLIQAPRNVDSLASETEMPVATVSQHLQVLRNAKLVESERDGTKIVYRLADPRVLKMFLALRSVAETRLPEVEQLVREYGLNGDEKTPLSQIKLEKSKVLIIDVRPKIEFETGHIPGAISMPVDELPKHIGELPKEKQIAAYCRGAYCLLADEAVQILTKNGFNAIKMEEGWAEWKESADRRVDHAGAKR